MLLWRFACTDVDVVVLVAKLTGCRLFSHRAGICSTDLEIIRGYVPGYCHTLGHEFVGFVEECAAQPSLVGTRVVGEINCNCTKWTCSDAICQRNHAPGRTVLGIINKDGAMAQYLTLPIENLHLVSGLHW